MNDTQRAISKAVLWGGLVASTVDIFAASTIFMANPLRILRSIAGGAFGKDAFTGGLPMSLAGLFLQWMMGLIIAAIYVTAARRLAWMHRDWRLAGLAYGVVVYFVMTYVVVPLSAFPIKRDPTAPFNWLGFGENLLAMLLFGLIIAYANARFLKPADAGPGHA